MDVSTAIAARRSVRNFRDTSVDPAVLTDIATRAARAATGGNLQPWHIDIVAGDAMARLKATMRERLAEGVRETPAYDVYPRELVPPYSERRFAIGEAMYAHLGIPRDDRPARRTWFARNFQFFGAPAAFFCTVDKRMGAPQWADMGMYLQNLMLLATERGLGTCAQECWAAFPDTIEAFLDTPGDRMLFCGVAIGHEDTDHPVNRLRSERAPEREWLRVVG